VNVQNIPRNQKDVKRAFVPKLDAFLFFDYRAIEVRLLAYYLARGIGDHSLANEINNGADPHLVTAQGLYGSELVTDEQRQVGKTLNFSIIYGGGTPTIIRQLDVPYKEARRLLTAYHETRPGIKQLNESIENSLRRGYITSLYGRRLHVQESHKALNALIQGSAADLMRDAVVKVHHYLNDVQFRSHIVNIVHDEIIIDTVDNEIFTLSEQIPKLMRNKTIEEYVNIGTDCEISRTNWAEKEAYNGD
jgi:DNA polymerase-1